MRSADGAQAELLAEFLKKTSSLFSDARARASRAVQ
jgi:hypothetical protein